MKNYVIILLAIFKKRDKFAELYLLSPKKSLWFGVSIFLYGVALTYIIYLPLMIIHGLMIDKLHFLIQFWECKLNSV